LIPGPIMSGIRIVRVCQDWPGLGGCGWLRTPEGPQLEPVIDTGSDNVGDTNCPGLSRIVQDWADAAGCGRQKDPGYSSACRTSMLMTSPRHQSLLRSATSNKKPGLQERLPPGCCRLALDGPTHVAAERRHIGLADWRQNHPSLKRRRIICGRGRQRLSKPPCVFSAIFDAFGFLALT
jgi:hypothetical protein